MINVFGMCYKMFVWPVCVIMHDDDQCVWYVLQNVCMACVCDNARR